MNIKVIVYRRPNMFKVNENIYNMCGLGELKNIFTIENYRSQGRLQLYYPERFLNVLEQRALIQRLSAVGYSDVIIVTHSVYIIQCTHAENIQIVQDDCINELDHPFKLSNDDSGMPDDNCLNVLY